MPTRQDGKPVLVSPDGSACELDRLSLRDHKLNEGVDLRDFVIAHPECLPVRQLDLSHAPLIPLGMEVSTDAGPIDCLFVSPSGLLTIVETKLWRNPEARREVVGQIIDYAKELAQWSYSDLDQRCRKKNGVGLWEHVCENANQSQLLDESDFIDQTSRALHEGRFLLLVVGDGIREDVERMAAYLQAAPQLLFSLHLVELQMYDFSDGSRLVVPQLIARTNEVTRAVVSVHTNGKGPIVNVDVPLKSTPTPSSKNRISEAEFLDQLEKNVPEFTPFMGKLIDEIANDSGLFCDTGISSLTIKAQDPSEPRVTYTLLQVTTAGNVSVWAVRDQVQRAGLPVELAEEYITASASEIGVGVSKKIDSWAKSVPIRQFAEHKDALIEMLRRFVAKIDAYRAQQQED